MHANLRREFFSYHPKTDRSVLNFVLFRRRNIQFDFFFFLSWLAFALRSRALDFYRARNSKHTNCHFPSLLFFFPLLFSPPPPTAFLLHFKLYIHTQAETAFTTHLHILSRVCWTYEFCNERLYVVGVYVWVSISSVSRALCDFPSSNLVLILYFFVYPSSTMTIS